MTNNTATTNNITSVAWDTLVNGTGIAYGCVSDTHACTNERKIDVLEKKIEELTKKPEVRPETTTKLDTKNGKIKVKHYKDGFFDSERTIMSDIKDVIVHNNTVLVMFADGTKTVAVLDEEDEFNLEQGISICITKKLLGQDGSSVYNKLIKRALKVKKQNEKAAEKAEKDKKEAKLRKEKALARHKQKVAKRREEEIELHKEAYIRAIEYFNIKTKKKK